MYVKESLPEPTIKLTGDKLELIALELSPSDHARPFVIVCWYRPPTAGIDDTAFENLRQILKNLDKEEKEIILIGDTNCGAPKSSLHLLDRVQSKAIRLINNPNLTNSLQSLSHRRLVADLSIFYRYFHGHCSQEIKNIIPDPMRRVRTTRSSTHSHPFQVTLPNPRTLAHKSSFIPRTSQLWNSLPPTSFPESYNLSSFKSNVNKLDLVSLST